MLKVSLVSSLRMQMLRLSLGPATPVSCSPAPAPGLSPFTVLSTCSNIIVNIFIIMSSHQITFASPARNSAMQPSLLRVLASPLGTFLVTCTKTESDQENMMYLLQTFVRYI